MFAPSCCIEIDVLNLDNTRLVAEQGACHRAGLAFGFDRDPDQRLEVAGLVILNLGHIKIALARAITGALTILILFNSGFSSPIRMRAVSGRVFSSAT